MKHPAIELLSELKQLKVTHQALSGFPVSPQTRAAMASVGARIRQHQNAIGKLPPKSRELLNPPRLVKKA